MHFSACLARRGFLLGLVLVSLHALGGLSRGAEWADTRVIGPFVCHADFSLAEMERLFADLAQLQNDLMRVLEIPAARERIEVYLFRDQSTYREYVGRYLPQVPYRRALYVKLHGPGMVFAYRSREFDVDLRHECTHALLHAVLPIVPLWLDEGLAEYFEVPPAQRAYDNPHLSGVRWAVRFGMSPKLESLEKKSDLSDMGKAEYRGAWAWVHFMIHGSPDSHDELVRYLRDSLEGVPPGQLRLRLEQRLPNLAPQFASHFKNWTR
jgi:hypothetical protein